MSVFALRTVLTPVSRQQQEPWPPVKDVSPVITVKSFLNGASAASDGVSV